MNLNDFWTVYWLCILLYLLLSFILYKIEQLVYGGIDDDQIGAFISLFIIFLIPVINVILIVFFIIGLFIKIMIVIEDIFNGDSKNN